MTLIKFSDELINAYLDGEIEGPLKDEVAAAIAENPDMLASYLNLSSMNQRVQEAGNAVENFGDQKADEDKSRVIDLQSRRDRRAAMPRRFAMAASLLVALGAGFVWNDFAREEPGETLAATWIYRATGAHQMVSFNEAWTPVTRIDEVPEKFSALIAEYRGEEALLQLGYVLQGWRLAGDGHGPIAIQLAYKKASGELATAFIRSHVEGGQSSAAMVINGVPTFFTGGNDVDTALIGIDLPYKDENWQSVAQQPRRI